MDELIKAMYEDALTKARLCFIRSHLNYVLPVLRRSQFEDIHSRIESTA